MAEATNNTNPSVWETDARAHVARLDRLYHDRANWVPSARYLAQAMGEIDRLRERLEMTHAWQTVDGKMVRVAVEPGSIPDGIECRDETIRLQDREIARLHAALAEKPHD